MITKTKYQKDVTTTPCSQNVFEIKNVPSYLCSYSVEAVLIRFVGSVANFSKKESYPWYFKFQVETSFGFPNFSNIRRELEFQEKVDYETRVFLRAQCKTIKVVSYLRQGYQCYHYYLAQPVAQEVLEKYTAWQAKKHNRKMRFDLEKDPKWKLVLKRILNNPKPIYDWIEYLPQERERLF